MDDKIKKKLKKMMINAIIAVFSVGLCGILAALAPESIPFLKGSEMILAVLLGAYLYPEVNEVTKKVVSSFTKHE